MNPRVVSLVGGVILVLACSRVSFSQERSQREGDLLLQELQGDWILESVEMAGMKREGEQLPIRFRGMKQSIRGDRVTVTRVDGKSFECRLTLNAATEPKQLDMVMIAAGENQSKSRTAKCIYKIADGKLIMAEGKTSRPTSFETGPDTSAKVSTFTRKR